MTCPYNVIISNYIIVGNEASSKSYVQYCILIEHRISKNVISLRYRYKELRNLHDQIQRDLEKYKLSIALPEFPSRKMIGKTNTNEGSIIQRKNDLEKYLNELIQYTQVQALPIVTSLLPSAEDALTKSSSKSQNKIKYIFAKKDDLYYMQESDCTEEYNNRDTISRLTNTNQYSAKIKSFERTGETILYNVHFYHMTSHLKWTSQYRYSELKNLHLGVKSCHHNKHVHLPEFPGRHFFSSTNDNIDEVFKRQTKLEKYLNDLLEIENIYPNNEALKNFIDSSKRSAFAEQLTQQYLQENNQNSINIMGSFDKYKGNNSNDDDNNNSKNSNSRYKFTKSTDISTFLFFHQSDQFRAKQQKRLLKRKAKKALATLNIQLVFEEYQDEEEDDE